MKKRINHELTQDQFIGNMVSKGLNELSEKTGLPVEYYSLNIDRKKLGEKFKELQEKSQENSRKGYDLKKNKKLQEDFQNYISSGEILNDRAKRASELEKGSVEIEPKTFYGKLGKFFGGKKFKEVDYNVHKHAKKLEGIASLVQSDPAYAKLAPDIAESLNHVSQLSYASNLLKVAHAEGMIDKKEYNTLVDKIYLKAENAVKTVPLQIKDYVGKIAASIFALFGIFILLSQAMSMTGRVIGGVSTFNYGILVAEGLLLVSLVLVRLSKTK
jgi:hypothetical protein